ncbi:MAG: hypothetical protein ACR2PZ_12520 [Pseudomonadales bacterium]
MSLAEMLLRLGCTMVAWLMIYTHLLWLATLRVVSCNSDGDAMWRLLLGFAPIALGSSFLLTLSRRLPAVHETLRWAATPLVLLLPLALLAIWPTFISSTMANQPICDGPIQPWHSWWSPIQFASVCVLSFMAYRAWREQPQPA